jgi:transcriptional regulator of met regulon
LICFFSALVQEEAFIKTAPGISLPTSQSSTRDRNDQVSTAPKNIKSAVACGDRNELRFSKLMGHDKPKIGIMQC